MQSREAGQTIGCRGILIEVTLEPKLLVAKEEEERQATHERGL